MKKRDKNSRFARHRLIGMLFCLVMAVSTAVAFATQYMSIAVEESEYVEGTRVMETDPENDNLENLPEFDFSDADAGEFNFSDESITNVNFEPVRAIAKILDLTVAEEGCTVLENIVEDIYAVELDESFEAGDNGEQSFGGIGMFSDFEDEETEKNIKILEYDNKVAAFSDTADWGVNYISGASDTSDFGAGMKIALFDTGVDLSHPDLEVSDGISFIDGISSYDDDNGHGTMVAGIIAAKTNDSGIIGLAPESEIYSVKVLDSNKSGYYSNVIKGIYWAIENDIDIISMPFGGTETSKLLYDAITLGVEKGILFIGATGNSGEDMAMYPAAFNNVLAVGSINANGETSEFSNGGADVFAPGENIYTTAAGGSYTTEGGTSLSCAHIVGAAAAVWSGDNDKIARQVELSIMKGNRLIYKSAEILVSNPQVSEPVYTSPGDGNGDGIIEGLVTVTSGTTVYSLINNSVTVTMNNFDTAHSESSITVHRDSQSGMQVGSIRTGGSVAAGGSYSYTVPSSYFTSIGVYYIKFVFSNAPSYPAYVKVNCVQAVTKTFGSTTVSYSGTLSAPSDADYYRISGIYGGERIYVSASGWVSSYDTDISLLTLNGTNEDAKSRSVAVGSNKETINAYVDEDNTYYVKIYRLSGSNSGTSSYDITISIYDDNDQYSLASPPNKQRADAKLLSVNEYTSVTGKISNTHDVDWFRIYAAQGIGVRFILCGVDSNGNETALPKYYDVFVYKGSSTTKYGNGTNWGTSIEDFSISPNESTQYYIQIYGYGVYSQTQYRLYIVFNNMPTNSLTVSNRAKNSVSISWSPGFSSTENKLYYRNSASTGSYTAVTANTVSSPSVSLSGISSLSDYVFYTSSRYSSYSTYTSVYGAFSTLDQYEPNNSVSDAPVLNVYAIDQFNASLDPVGEYDYYKFNNTAAGTAYLYVMASSSSLNPYLSATINGSAVALTPTNSSGTTYYAKVWLSFAGTNNFRISAPSYGSKIKYAFGVDFRQSVSVVTELHMGGSGTYLPTGNYSQTFNDFGLVSRTYNSSEFSSGMFGQGWNFAFEGKIANYSRKFLLSTGWVESVSVANTKIVTIGGNEHYLFEQSGSSFTALDSRHVLQSVSGGGWKLIKKDKTEYGFNSSGYLTSIKDKYENVTAITTDTSGKVTGITQPSGRTYTVNYTSGTVSSIVDNAGQRTVSYSYTTGNSVNDTTSRRLETVTLPDNSGWNYTYNSRGQLASISQKSTAGASKFLESLSYVTSGENIYKVSLRTDIYGNVFTHSYGSGLTTVTDSNGRVTKQAYDSKKFITTEFSEYDIYGNVKEIKETDNAIIEFNYDNLNRLTEKYIDSKLVEKYIYDPNINKVTKRAELRPARPLDKRGFGKLGT
jgi:YD repeat-containing protein